MDSANNVTKVEAGVKNEAVDTNKVETLVVDQTVIKEETKEVQEPKKAETEASEAKNAVEIGVGDASEVKNADDLVSDDSEDDTGNSEDEVNVNVPNPNTAGDGPNQNKDKPPSTEAPTPRRRVEALWVPLVPSGFRFQAIPRAV